MGEFFHRLQRLFRSRLKSQLLRRTEKQLLDRILGWRRELDSRTAAQRHCAGCGKQLPNEYRLECEPCRRRREARLATLINRRAQPSGQPAEPEEKPLNCGQCGKRITGSYWVDAVTFDRVRCHECLKVVSPIDRPVVLQHEETEGATVYKLPATVGYLEGSSVIENAVRAWEDSEV